MRGFHFLITLLVVLQFLSLRIQAQETKRYSVLVLGAGAAGIQAGITLKKSGVEDFLILEGDNRIGGRVFQGNIGGTPIELGANWLSHYTELNPIIAPARAAGLTCTTNAPTTLFTETGPSPTSDADTTRVSGFWGAAFVDPRYSNPANDENYIQAFERQSGATVASLTNSRRAILYALVANGGQNPEEASMRRNIDGRSFGAEASECLVNDAGGYIKLINYWVNTTNLTPKIQLNTIVEKIDYSGSDVVVTVRNSQTVYRANQVIVTFSLGVLKNKVNLFAPPIPDAQRGAINRWGYGNLLKVFLKFRTAWWPNDNLAWYYNDGRAEKYWPSYFINLNHANLIPGSATVLFFAIDAVANRIIGQSKQATIDEVMVAFRNMFPGSPVENPTDLTFKNWAADELHYGSYSFGKLGATDADKQVLNQSLANKVHFAGEHTSANYWGYVHGAYMEGEAVANRVVTLLRNTAAPTPSSAPTSAPTTGPSSAPTTGPSSAPTPAPTPRSSASSLFSVSILILTIICLL